MIKKMYNLMLKMEDSRPRSQTYCSAPRQ